MAELVLEGDEVVLRMSRGEHLLAAHRDVRVPVSAVRSVDLLEQPIQRIRGLRPRYSKALGGYWPGAFAYGSFFDGTVHRRLFAAVGGRTGRGLEVGLDGARYSRLVVSLDQPELAKAALAAALTSPHGARRPR
jgi:hypothetical protein